MVFSVKANKNKIIAVLVLIAIIVCMVIFLPNMMKEPETIKGETAAERAEFLSSFGWQVSADPIDQRDVVIPEEFSEIYETYNIMQKAQGFDLSPYKGVQCRQYIYRVENYPIQGIEVFATLLVTDGTIIGGDISCAEVGGFMHGFAKDSAHYGQTDSTENSQTEATPTPTVAPESETTDPNAQAVDPNAQAVDPNAQAVDPTTVTDPNTPVDAPAPEYPID